jgi:hypothetical protein
MKTIKRIGSILLGLGNLIILIQVVLILVFNRPDLATPTTIIFTMITSFGGLFIWAIGYSHKPFPTTGLTFKKIFWEYPK